MDNYILCRSIVGLFFLVDMLVLLSDVHPFLSTAYHKKGVLASPLLRNLSIGLWILASTSLMMGWYPLLSLLILLTLFRHVYINRRWDNMIRGGGAPGIMSFFTVSYFSLIEIGAYIDPTLPQYALNIMRIDLGVIMICAGAYKFGAGYLRGEGFEYALVNPIWSHGFQYFWKLKSHPYFHFFLNASAVLGELGSGILLLFPTTAIWGASILIFIFLVNGFILRLGRLPFLMMALGLLWLPSFGGTSFVGNSILDPSLAFPIALTIKGILAFYAFLILPLAKIMQYMHYFSDYRMPRSLSRVLQFLIKHIPIVMWRVFTPDIINFFVRIYKYENGKKVLFLDEKSYLYNRGLKSIFRNLRYLNVLESVVLSNIFMMYKYFPTNLKLFKEKIKVHAKSLEEDRFAVYEYEYVAVHKSSPTFEYIPVMNFQVDLEENLVSKIWEHEDAKNYIYSVRSPIKEAQSYGEMSFKPKIKNDYSS